MLPRTPTPLDISSVFEQGDNYSDRGEDQRSPPVLFVSPKKVDRSSRNDRKVSRADAYMENAKKNTELSSEDVKQLVDFRGARMRLPKQATTVESERCEPRNCHQNQKQYGRKAERLIADVRQDRGYSLQSSHFVKPPKFDGKGCVESHLVQFKIAANRNYWSEEDKTDFLKISLTGDASTVLNDMAEDATYGELVSKLQQCYSTLETLEAFQVQLKARRKIGQSLSDLMKDVRRLFSLAYPGKSNYISDIAAKDAYIDALDDRELMIRVLEREPKTLEEAFKISERMELYARRVDINEKTESESGSKMHPNKVRTVTSTLDPSLKALIDNQKKMQQQLTSLIKLIQKREERLQREEGEVAR